MTLTHSGASELGQLMEGTTAGALIPEIVRRGFQDLLEAEVSAAIGAQLHERRPDERATHRNGYRERVLTTQVGDLTLAIPKLRQGSFLRNTSHRKGFLKWYQAHAELLGPVFEPRHQPLLLGCLVGLNTWIFAANAIPQDLVVDRRQLASCGHNSLGLPNAYGHAAMKGAQRG
jgi:hypothetical protein